MADFGFSIRDILAVGSVDVHASTKWTKHASASHSVAKVPHIQGGISIRREGNPVDAFSYGTVLESRILRDSIPEITIPILLSDAASGDTLLDNEKSGALQLIEVGMQNPNGDKLLLQFWQARLIGLDYQFQDDGFATVSYTYRGTDFRATSDTNAQIVSFSG